MNKYCTNCGAKLEAQYIFIINSSLISSLRPTLNPSDIIKIIRNLYIFDMVKGENKI